jgi:hypothetical protein
MISKIFSLRNYVMKQLMKSNKEGILKIPDKGKVDFGEMIIKEELFKKGIEPKMIKSENQLDNILNTPSISKSEMIKPKKSGEVINVDFDKGRWKDIDPEKKAQGGSMGTGLNYLLGEDDQNTRVPYSDGSTQEDFNEYLKEREKRDKEEHRREFKKDFLDDFEKWKKWRDTQGGTMDFAADGGRIGLKEGSKKESWRNKLTRWGGGPSVIAGELGFEGLNQIYHLLGMGGLYAEGGRTGFGIGGLSRRAFLKLMGGTAATVGAAKTGLFGLLKSGKPTIVKDLASVPIGSAEGMPAWFKPLVNKVLKEGDDVTKKFATKEREIVHTKKIGDPKDKFADEITVTQDLETGNVRVEYNAAHNMGEAPIQLDYKAGEVIEKGSKKGTKTKPQFSAVESEPRITNWDGDIEWDGENIVSKVDDLLTDTTKLETYATGKNPPIKKLLKSEQKKKYVNKLNDDQMEQIEYIDNKTGHLAPESLMDEPLPDDYPFASGGRVPLAGGLIVKGGNWLIKSLLDTRKQLKTMNLSPGQLKQFLNQIDDQIKNLEAGGKIPDEVIQTIRKDPKFKSVWQNQKSADPDLREMEEVLLEYGTKHASGGRVPLAGGSSPMHGNYSVDEILEFKKMLMDNGYSPGEANDYVRWLLKRNKVLEFPSVKFSAGGVAGLLGE